MKINCIARDPFQFILFCMLYVLPTSLKKSWLNYKFKKKNQLSDLNIESHLYINAILYSNQIFDFFKLAVNFYLHDAIRVSAELATTTWPAGWLAG